MTEEERLEGSEELFDLMDKLPKRISGALQDGFGITFDSVNKTWIVQRKIQDRLVKLTVPSEFSDVVKRLKELMVHVRSADLEHMEEIRKKMRDVRQPILEEEIAQGSWNIRVNYKLGQTLFAKAMRHVELSQEELRDADAATQKLVSYYERLRNQDVNRMSLDEAEKRRRMEAEAAKVAKSCGYTVVSRQFSQFVIVKYTCPNTPPMPGNVKGMLADHVGEVMIAENRWNPEREEQAIRDDIALRMNSLF